MLSAQRRSQETWRYFGPPISEDVSHVPSRSLIKDDYESYYVSKLVLIHVLHVPVSGTQIWKFSRGGNVCLCNHQWLLHLFLCFNIFSYLIIENQHLSVTLMNCCDWALQIQRNNVNLVTMLHWDMFGSMTEKGLDSVALGFQLAWDALWILLCYCNVVVCSKCEGRGFDPI